MVLTCSIHTLVNMCPPVNSKSNIYLGGGGSQRIMFSTSSKVTLPAPPPLTERIVIAVLTDMSDQLGLSALTDINPLRLDNQSKDLIF